MTFSTNLKLWTDKMEREKNLREKLNLMSKLNEESLETTVNMGSVKPVTKNRLERTMSVKR